MMIIDILQVNSGVIVAISDEVTKHINSDINSYSPVDTSLQEMTTNKIYRN